jgi:serine/threonine protein kinase
MKKIDPDSPVMYTVMELCIDGMNLHEILRSMNAEKKQYYKHYSQTAIFDMVAVAGTHVLSELHAAGICHCDIKPGNIMLCEDNTDQGVMTARIIDFGSSTTERVCKFGSDLFVPYRKYQSIVYDEINTIYGVNFDMIPNMIPNMEGIVGSSKGIRSNLYKDKFALGLTLGIILGHTSDDGDKLRKYFCKSLMDDIDWTEAKKKLSEFLPIPDPQGGAKRKAKRERAKNAPAKWVSTGLKASVKRPHSASSGPASSLKTVFKNSVTGELRVRKATVAKNGSRKFSYVKFT